MNNQQIESIKRIGTGLSFMLFPVLFLVVYAAHPNLLSLARVTNVEAWIAEFHGNAFLHFGHALMLLSVPLLIVVALKLMDLLRERGAWFGVVGGVMAIFGSVILAADKGALCLVTSAFDTLPEQQFALMLPGLEAMQNRAGWLVLLWLLALLPLGFAIQAVGLFVTRAVPRWQSGLLCVGALMLLNPDIEIISVVASLLLMVALVPLGIQMLRGSDYDARIKPPAAGRPPPSVRSTTTPPVAGQGAVR